VDTPLALRLWEREHGMGCAGLRHAATWGLSLLHSGNAPLLEDIRDVGETLQQFAASSGRLEYVR
jgi:hypothetical protein